MSLRRAVAAPFRQRGVERMTESEFVVALSLDRDWFSPDQAQRLITVAESEGLVGRGEDTLTPTFDPAGVDIPDDFEPEESILQERTTFERVLDAITAAGVDKQTAVGDINRLQGELELTVEAAAVLYAHRHNVDVTDLAGRVRAEL
jgi:hypothetical protein